MLEASEDTLPPGSGTATDNTLKNADQIIEKTGVAVKNVIDNIVGGLGWCLGLGGLFAWISTRRQKNK